MENTTKRAIEDVILAFYNLESAEDAYGRESEAFMERLSELKAAVLDLSFESKRYT